MLVELLVVPGHGVCKEGCTRPPLPQLDTSWIGSFPGEGALLVEHIRRGVLLAGQRNEAALLFSGGQTQAPAGARSEAKSYYAIAHDAHWWEQANVESRAFTEEFARDSFENLLCSIARFRQLTGRWPDAITVVGWWFKARRFELHRQALGWPSKRFAYVGVNDPEGDAVPAALAGEEAKVAAIEQDPCLLSDRWQAQRRRRDPFGRGSGYRGVDPALDQLLDARERRLPIATLPAW